jgi:hypothetical protein
VNPDRPPRPNVLLGAALAAAAVVTGPALVAAPASAASSASVSKATCRTALTATLGTTDPTTLQDEPLATVRLTGARAATGVRVTLLRAARRLGTGRATGTLKRGTGPVALRLQGVPGSGNVRVVVRGAVAGCGTVRTATTVRLASASLPVRATLRGTTTVGGRSVVRVLLRAVGGRRSSGVRVTLRDARGATVAGARVAGTFSGLTEVALRASTVLPAGSYGVTVAGRASGTRAIATARVALSAATTDASTATAAPALQHAVVDWSGGRPAGRDVVGFVLPGIGHGEVTCGMEGQGLRVFPTDQGRETSMMTWTYKDWGGAAGTPFTHEKALREALHTTGTGRDFTEALNRFGPSEKQSTGEFVALLTDRGTIGAAGDAALAAPIGIHVTWAWDLSSAGSARCHVETDVVAQVPGGTGVGSAQLVWRGDAAAPGRDTAVSDVPGLGRLTLVCQAGPAGTRQLTLATDAGATVTTRQADQDVAVPQAAGPIVVELPNNGQVLIAVDGGGSVLVSSRRKVNDPDGAANSCAVSAQAIAGA